MTTIGFTHITVYSDDIDELGIRIAFAIDPSGYAVELVERTVAPSQ